MVYFSYLRISKGAVNNRFTSDTRKTVKREVPKHMIFNFQEFSALMFFFVLFFCTEYEIET